MTPITYGVDRGHTDGDKTCLCILRDIGDGNKEAAFFEGQRAERVIEAAETSPEVAAAAAMFVFAYEAMSRKLGKRAALFDMRVQSARSEWLAARASATFNMLTPLPPGPRVDPWCR